MLRDGKPVYERAIGWSDKEAGRKMTANTIFRIASQTKAITSTAILALMEEGKIGIQRAGGPFHSYLHQDYSGGEGGLRGRRSFRPSARSPSRIC